jgi:hypothetical protein
MLQVEQLYGCCLKMALDPRHRQNKVQEGYITHSNENIIGGFIRKICGTASIQSG